MEETRPRFNGMPITPVDRTVVLGDSLLARSLSRGYSLPYVEDHGQETLPSRAVVSASTVRPDLTAWAQTLIVHMTP